MEVTSERGDDSGIDSNADSGDNSIYIRVNIPELKIQKCLQFHNDDTVWMAKQRVLSILSKELKDSLNFGLYCPPMNGRAGKFLDEERPLKDYPLPGPIGFLEFKYKRRVYKLMQLNPRRLKQLHSRSNLKQFMEHVRKYDMEKLNRMTIRGLDPNFHEPETGETPLSVASQQDKPRNLILAIVGGGAHIDYRTRREGFTPLHRAAQRGNYDAIKVFLDLGASPNYKDIRSLTPLYHCVCHDTNPRCVELLLHDHSIVGVTDDRGWTEVHQACKNGRVQHLEHLLFYGAEMNLQNSSGNTPLHVCAVNNQEECARVLLFRGVDKGFLNFANQDAFQVAVIAGNCELGDIIKNYKEQDVVPFQELPQYNDKRRMTVTSATLHKLQRSRSDPRLNLIGQSTPSSPAPSNNSMPHFLANGTFFDPSGVYQNVRRSKDEYAGSEASMSMSSGGSFTGSYVSDNGPMMRSVSCDMLNTYNNDTSANSRYSVSDWSPYVEQRRRPVPAPPSRTFICTYPHTPQRANELPLAKGDFVQVLGVGESGYWEGRVGPYSGCFPSHCVQEVLVRSPGNHSNQDDQIVLNKSTLSALTKSESRENTPTSVRLHKGKNGFGFVLRGAKSQHQATSTLEFKPTADFPALQYLDRVDRDSMADRAGLKAGDFLLEINGESVVNATHEHTVSLIKHAGDTLDMKVVTVKPLDNDQHNQRDIHADGTRTLPLKKKAPKPPSRDPQTSLSRANQEHALTAIESFTAIDRLDRTLAQYDNEADRQSLGTASDSYVMNSMAAARGIDPNNKTASISRRTKRLSSTPLDGIYERQGSRDMNLDQSASNQQRPVVSGMEKIYASPQEARVQENGHQQHLTRVHLQDKDDHSTRQYAEISPNVTNVRLSTTAAHDKVYQGHQQDKVYQGHHQTADGIYAVPFKHQPDGLSVKITDNDSDITAIPPHPHMAPPEPPPHNRSRNIPPPPVHAPPSSPHSRELSQVVPIQTQQNQYANVSGEIERQRSGTDSDSSSYESSFRPGTNARMSIDPTTTQTHANNHSRNSSGTSSMSSATSHSDHISGNGAPSSRSSKSSLTVAADVHHSPQVNQKFYEPEPDYEKSESPRKLPPGDIASLRSVREAWSSTSTSVTNTTSGSDKIPTTPATNSTHVAASSRTAEVLKSSTHDTAVRHTTTTTHSQAPQASRSPPTTSTTAATKSPTPPPPPTSQTPTSPRHTDDNVMSAFGNAIKLAALARDKRQQDEISKPKAPPPPPAVSAAAPPAPLVAMAAPGIPPPPPPPSLTPSSDSSPVVVKRSLPPHIQKQLDETKKREESHNALMAAVAKRRNVVETIDMGNIADTIETRIQRGKKLQTIVYKSDQSKPEVKTTVLPAAPLLQLDQARPDTEEKKPEEKTKKTTNHHLDDHVNNNMVSKENGASPGHVTATQKASNMDFLAAAEKARQDYLQKKQQATLERKTGGKSSSGGTHDSSGGTQDAATTVTSPKPPVNPEPKTQAPLGNLAHIIAQRAIQRQKSSEGVLENHNNNNASSGEPTNRSTTRTADWSSNSLEIHGATTDYSQTETPRSSRTPSFSHMNGNSPMSVSARKKMFEADRARAADNVPPLVIPPPQDFNPTKTHAPSKTNNVYGGHAKTHDGAINSKSSRHHQGNTGVHNGIGNHSNGPAHMVMVDSVRCVENGVVDVDFIPPPPLFDTEHAFDSVVYRTVAEDSVSMVSSLSTLSTLSSAEDSVDSPIHSASYSLVPPPPPGFDDSPSTSLSASMEFIPPPFEFDTPVNSPEPMSPLSGTLKNIVKSGQSHSISYPAMRAAPPGGAGHQDKPIEAWTQSDVSSWLESLQLHEHQGHFAQGNITGQMLIQLDRHRLISLGVNQVGHRMAIERAIKKAVMKH